MKIALVTANYGSIDEVLEVTPQNVDCDFYCFNEKNSPFPLPNLDNRTKARYIKMQMHRFLPGYDIYIWRDGRVQVTSEDYVRNYVHGLKAADFMCTLHNERKFVFDELEFILWQMNKGNHYLISRYGHQSLRKELEFYKEKGFPDKEQPLFSSGMFGRWNNARANAVCDEWWMRSLEYSNFDQAMLSFVLWEADMKVFHIPYVNSIFKVLKHIPHDTY